MVRILVPRKDMLSASRLRGSPRAPAFRRLVALLDCLDEVTLTPTAGFKLAWVD